MESNDDCGVDRDEFYEKLCDLFRQRAPNTYLLTSEKYMALIKQMKLIESGSKKHPADYRRLRKYQVVNTPDGERLYAVQKPGDSRRQMFVSLNETYDIIREYHLKLNHGGRTRMMYALKDKYRNITTQSVLLYLSMCTTCKNKSVKRTRLDNSINMPADYAFEDSDDTDPLCETQQDMEVETEEEVSEQLEKKFPEQYSRAQVDILGVNIDEADEFQYLLVYRNYITKFIHLKPMKAICVDEAVEILLEIFLVFGVPNILQSKNGSSVVKSICKRISNLCPDLKIVSSEATFNYNDFKGKSNNDILKKLNELLNSTKSIKWHHGLKFIQHTLNTTFNDVVCRTPSEMVFGTNPGKGIVSFMKKDDYESLMTENDLVAALDEIENPKTSKKEFQLQESLVLPEKFIKLEVERLDNETIELENSL